MIPIVGDIISGVANFFGKREQRKAAKARAQAKLAQKRLDGDLNVEISRAEWEEIGKLGEDKTWKDEYVTIIFTMPIIGLMVGAVYLAFTGDDRLISGINAGIAALETLGLDYGEITYIIVLAAVGIKGIKTLK